MSYAPLILATVRHSTSNLEIAIAWVALVLALVLATLLLVTPLWALILYLSQPKADQAAPEA